MSKLGINQSRSRLNNLIEVPSLYGQKKLSLAGKGRCYYDFLDGVEKTIPLIFELHEVNSLGSFAHYINVSKSGDLFKALYQFTQIHHPERVRDVLYLARMIWMANKQGISHIFSENVYLSTHNQVMELEALYRDEHSLLETVVAAKEAK